MSARTLRALAALACLSCVSLAASLPAQAATAAQEEILQNGDSNFSLGFYTRALEIFTPLAQQGEGHAQAMLAELYLGQTDVPRDSKQAVQWAEKSAAQDHPDGLLVLARMYLTGDAVPKNPAKAVALLQRGVALNSAKCKLQLGLIYLNGKGIDRDPAQARQLLESSAKQGLFQSQVTLGRLVLNEGTPLGARLPHAGEATEEAHVPPVSAAVKKAASSGNAMAQLAAGALYIDGAHGIPFNRDKAQDWFTKGVAQLP